VVMGSAIFGIGGLILGAIGGLLRKR